MTKTKTKRVPFLEPVEGRALLGTVAVVGLASAMAIPGSAPVFAGLAVLTAAAAMFPVVPVRPTFDAREALRIGYGKKVVATIPASDLFRSDEGILNRIGTALARWRGYDNAPVVLDAATLRAGVAINGRFGAGRSHLSYSLERQTARSGGGVIHFDGTMDHAAFERLQDAVHGREDDAFLIDLRDDGTLQSLAGTRCRTIDPFHGLSEEALARMIGRLAGVEAPGAPRKLVESLSAAMAKDMLCVHRGKRVCYEDIRARCDLASIQRMARMSTSANARGRATRYLMCLDGYVEEKGERQSARTMEEHARVVATLIEHCDAILAVPGAIDCEDATVSMVDVVVGRRLLVIVSPERMPHHVQCLRASLEAALSLPSSRSPLPLLIVEDELAAFHSPSAADGNVIDWWRLGRDDVYSVVAVDPSSDKDVGRRFGRPRIIVRPGATILMSIDGPVWTPPMLSEFVNPLDIPALKPGEAFMIRMGGATTSLTIDYLPRRQSGRSRVSADVLVPAQSEIAR